MRVSEKLRVVYGPSRYRGGGWVWDHVVGDLVWASAGARARAIRVSAAADRASERRALRPGVVDLVDRVFGMVA